MGAVLRQLPIRHAEPPAAEHLASDSKTLALPATWSIADLAGRLIEVTGRDAAGRTSWLARLVAQTQREGETAAWLQVAPGQLYPPDLQTAGIDVRALAVGMLPDGPALLRAADVLLRSGGFGLVVVDLDGVPLRPTDGQLGRLLGLCQKHGAALALLTREVAGGTEPGAGLQLGSLVSLRLQMARDLPAAGRCTLRAEVVKDKRRGPGRRLQAQWHTPDGML